MKLRLVSHARRVACWLGLALLCGVPQHAYAQGFLIPTQQAIAPLSLKSHRVMVKIQGRAAGKNIYLKLPLLDFLTISIIFKVRFGKQGLYARD